ncbi:hypothetical protein BGW80DRAFT_90271 [Lactifluus volemus]|nr:hypothetical protein BGW80DRAFT_90271 [Lactifluus volemus]
MSKMAIRRVFVPTPSWFTPLLQRRTSVKEMLDVWPPFPIEIRSSGLGDNIMAALEHQDRICEINLDLTYPECERLATVMQKPFPALTSLRLRSALFEDVPVLPDTFLGISAPRLRSLFWEGLAFPKLPQLILSFNDLSKLYLQSIPDHGYISPDAMVTGLSALTRLTYLCFDFDFEEIVAFRPRPPLTRVLLPALTESSFVVSTSTGRTSWLGSMFLNSKLSQSFSSNTPLTSDQPSLALGCSAIRLCGGDI